MKKLLVSLSVMPSAIARRASVGLLLALLSTSAFADADYERALKRAQYMLNASVPTDEEFAVNAQSHDTYKAAVRSFVESPNFYDAMMRYHERLFGTGLPTDYLDELQNDNIDNKANKFARISCNRAEGADQRFRCYWSSRDEGSRSGGCPKSWEQAVTVFWYPGIVAWVCPSVVRACGSDLSRCFIEYENQDEARNAELGTTEIFDSRFAVVKSLSKQAAGIASAVVTNNYPYTKILEPGLTAVDGSIAHFYRQTHHFDLNKLNPPAQLIEIVDNMPLTDTKFTLVFTGNTYEQAGVLTTFGWLRRYEKNRTRANQLYERLLCRKFTSELPRVFPNDPGNLRETPGCMGCHATLDPLADFFASWGEGGELYRGQGAPIQTTFGGQSGSSLQELADIIRNDNAFGACAVEHAWTWLMGRGFYRDEADLRAALTSYFATTGFSFKELIYAIATHPGFVEGARGDALVGDPLEMPPLGEPPGGNTDQPCESEIDFATDIQPRLTQCTNCHNATSEGRQDLSTEAQWEQLGSTAVNMMASGSMPPGQAGPPHIGAVYELKENVRCWLEQNR
jgi:hypothetical protein